MHEIALCTSIARIASATAEGLPVERVRVDIGHLRQVVPDTLRHCWEMVVFDTSLSGAELIVREVPALVECRQCGAATVLSEPILVCATCGSADTTVVSGEEMNVTSIDVTVA